MQINVLALCLVLACSTTAAEPMSHDMENLKIDTRLGPVTGLSAEGRATFLGIPYAAPPVGKRRWMPPAGAASWPEPFDATSYPNRCLQPSSALLAGREIPGELSEDCLYLNIYTPAADGKKRPVMFWIHGGAYTQGSANQYDGGALSTENDVVVVIINYRLGVFGFMDLSHFGPAYDGSASLGFQDQIAALTWVRDNIADYGGNPDNVTIFGESAGGGSVLALLAAPDAKGLFHKAIGFSPGEVTKAPEDNIPALVSRYGSEGPALLQQLLDLPAESVFELQREGVVSTDAVVDGTVVTVQPSKAILHNGSAGVPLIVGCNKDEGSFMADAIPPELRELLIPSFARIIGNGDTATYLSLLEEMVPSGDQREKLVRIWFDLFRSSSLRTAEASTVVGVGGWVFGFEMPGSTPFGTAHGSDVAFTFNTLNQEGGGPPGFHAANEINKDIAKRWSRTFAMFARTGDPNGAGLPHWPQYDPVKRATLVVDEQPRVVLDPDGSKLRSAYGMRQD